MAVSAGILQPNVRPTKVRPQARASPRPLWSATRNLPATEGPGPARGLTRSPSTAMTSPAPAAAAASWEDHACGLVLRPYQRRAFEAFQRRPADARKFFLLAPPGS